MVPWTKGKAEGASQVVPCQQVVPRTKLEARGGGREVCCQWPLDEGQNVGNQQSSVLPVGSALHVNEILHNFEI